MATHKNQHILFVDRIHEIQELDDFLTNPPSAARHRAIIAPRRMGKSELITAFRRKHPRALLPYVDIEAAGSSPERVVLRIVAAVVADLVGQRDAARDIAGVADVLVLGARLPESSLRRITALFDQVAAGRLGGDDAIRQALVAAEQLSRDAKKHGVLFIDECQDWFAPPGAKPTPLEATLRELGDDAIALRYCFAGSATRVMEATFRESEEGPGRPRRPLHGRVGILTLGPLTREDTRKIVEDEWRGHTYSRDALERVFVLTRGHPAASDHIAERAARAARRAHTKIEVGDISAAFFAELFERNGYVNAIMDADFKSATYQPRGSKALDQAVRAIADLGPDKATLSQISAVTGIASPNLSTWLPHLVDIDLLMYAEDTKTYSLKSTMMSTWLRGREHWTPGSVAAIPPRLVTIVEEELARARNELGSSFEARVRDTAAGFDGRQMDGAIFGQPGPVELPRVTAPVRPLEDRDTRGAVFAAGTSVQVDIYVGGPAIWLGEVKHRGHAASAKDLKLFNDKCEFFKNERKMGVAVRWFVSQSGFEDKAIAFATANGILTTKLRDLERLERELARPVAAPIQARAPRTPRTTRKR